MPTLSAIARVFAYFLSLVLFSHADPSPVCTDSKRSLAADRWLTGGQGLECQTSPVCMQNKLNLLVGATRCTRNTQACTNTMSQHRCESGISISCAVLGIRHIGPLCPRFGRPRIAQLFDNKLDWGRIIGAGSVFNLGRHFRRQTFFCI